MTIADAMNGGWALTVICFLIAAIVTYLVRRQNKHETLISLAATRDEMKEHFDQVKQQMEDLKDISKDHATKDGKFRHDNNDWQQGVSNQLAVLNERTKTQTESINKQAEKIDNLSQRVAVLDGEKNRAR
jgi:uncharacterized protein (DUF3084 family)